MSRVLLVEDHERLAHLVSTALTAVSVAVDSVKRVDSASTLQQVPYSALILNRVLPNGDGLVLLKQLRAAEPRVPYLATAAREALSVRVEGLNTGAADYLPQVLRHG